MFCPQCSVENREDAVFCKNCGYKLSQAPKPVREEKAAPPPPTAALRPIPPMPPSRAWWLPLGIVSVLSAFLLLVDFVSSRRLSWSIVIVAALSLVAGGYSVLEYLLAPRTRDQRRMAAGMALLLIGVVLSPLAYANLVPRESTEVFRVQYDGSVEKISLAISVDVGEISVSFASGNAYLLQITVVHKIGIFWSHPSGDVTFSNTTAGRLLAASLETTAGDGFLSGAGHTVSVSIHKSLELKLTAKVVTGQVSADVPANVKIESVDIGSTTGSVYFKSTNVRFTSGASLIGQATTGSVNFNITQNVDPDNDVTLLGKTTTGNVAFRFAHSPEVGATLSATTNVGSVNYDPAKYVKIGALYQTLNFSTSTRLVQGTLEATTGNIEIA